MSRYTLSSGWCHHQEQAYQVLSSGLGLDSRGPKGRSLSSQRGFASGSTYSLPKVIPTDEVLGVTELELRGARGRFSA
ncbi:MAG: hypothetical protein AAF702_44310 [Chloroflexota bacterium]